MALKTLLQTRTDFPAVLPIDPDECILLDQQTDQPDGEQSTACTASELIATGGRVVTVDEAYTTVYADSVVNVTVSNITITIGSDMPIGGRKVIRRLSAYDGNALVISPPSGATFEGKSSISLYGQYSFVEVERISATLFAVRDIEDYYETSTGGVEIKGKILRQWGVTSSNTPSVQVSNYFGTTAGTRYYGNYTHPLIRPFGNTKYSVQFSRSGTYFTAVIGKTTTTFDYQPLGEGNSSVSVEYLAIGAW